MVTQPSLAVPSSATPVIDPKTGQMTTPWRQFFARLTQLPPPVQLQTPGASPWDFTASVTGNLLIVGGTVSAVVLARGRDTVSTGLIAGFFPMSQQDVLTITYSVAPTAYFIPLGANL